MLDTLFAIVPTDIFTLMAELLQLPKKTLRGPRTSATPELFFMTLQSYPAMIHGTLARC
jgi:hypothetical protein